MQPYRAIRELLRALRGRTLDPMNRLVFSAVALITAVVTSSPALAQNQAASQADAPTAAGEALAKFGPHIVSMELRDMMPGPMWALDLLQAPTPFGRHCQQEVVTLVIGPKRAVPQEDYGRIDRIIRNPQVSVSRVSTWSRYRTVQDATGCAAAGGPGWTTATGIVEYRTAYDALDELRNRLDKGGLGDLRYTCTDRPSQAPAHRCRDPSAALARALAAPIDEITDDGRKVLDITAYSAASLIKLNFRPNGRLAAIDLTIGIGRPIT
jgi:hypothetical protein